MLMFGWDFLLMLSRDSEDEMWSRFMFELLIWLQEATLARWTQSSGPLCLWQCFLHKLNLTAWCQISTFTKPIQLPKQFLASSNLFSQTNMSKWFLLMIQFLEHLWFWPPSPGNYFWPSFLGKKTPQNSTLFTFFCCPKMSSVTPVVSF